MTNDSTQVAPEELATFSRSALDRAKETVSAADKVTGVHLGVDMLGVISTTFVNRVVAEQQDLDSKLRAMAEALTQDGNAARANADAVANNEATQSSQFKQTEHS